MNKNFLKYNNLKGDKTKGKGDMSDSSETNSDDLNNATFSSGDDENPHTVSKKKRHPDALDSARSKGSRSKTPRGESADPTKNKMNNKLNQLFGPAVTPTPDGVNAAKGKTAAIETGGKRNKKNRGKKQDAQPVKKKTFFSEESDGSEASEMGDLEMQMFFPETLQKKKGKIDEIGPEISINNE